MKKLNIQISPVLDVLVKKLSQIVPQEEIEIVLPTFRKSFGGPSWDFAGYRDYSPTDDASLIDWKASVRSNKILVKEFTEIQTLNILFLLDVSESMMQGTVGKRKIDFASEVIATLSYSILKSKGLVRLALFSDSIIKFLPSINELTQFYQIRNTLTNEELLGKKADLNMVSKMISPHLYKGTVLILVSDFLNLGNNWEESVRALGIQVNVMGFIIRDPIDRSLPKGVNKVFIEEPGTERKFILNVRKYRKKYEKATKEQELQLQNTLNSVNADFLLFDTSEPYLDKLTTYLRGRRKKFH